MVLLLFATKLPYFIRISVSITAVSESQELFIEISSTFYVFFPRRRCVVFFRQRHKGFDFDHKLMFFDNVVRYYQHEISLPVLYDISNIHLIGILSNGWNFTL